MVVLQVLQVPLLTLLLLLAVAVAVAVVTEAEAPRPRAVAVPTAVPPGQVLRLNTIPAVQTRGFVHDRAMR
jgi:hypothetical protein